jgi:hypothetical protein
MSAIRLMARKLDPHIAKLGALSTGLSPGQNTYELCPDNQRHTEEERP